MNINYCPYCNKQETVLNLKNYSFYFCSNCFKKWFGFSIKEYENTKDKNEIYKKMFNNYKINKSFIDYYGSNFWYKQKKLYRDNDQPAVVYSDGTKRWYKNGKFIKQEI
jgi:hypothetical protein